VRFFDKKEDNLANISVHIAVAQEWAKKHKVANLDDFVWGAVAPDILGKTQGSHITHYCTKVFNDDMDLTYLKERYDNRVNIDNYLNSVNVNSDYELGYLLHLVTDKFYYSNFLNIEKIKNMCKTYSEVKKIVYQTYDATLKFVNETYNVNYQNKHRQMDGLFERYGNCYIEEEPILYTKEELRMFIEQMSNVDLENFLKNHELKHKEEENVRQI